MKPRDRVVTAEDIQNSLYFVHVDHPEDFRFVEPPPSFREPQYQQQAPLQENQPPSQPIPRKAIPGASAPLGPDASVTPKRKAIPGSIPPNISFQSRQNTHATSHPGTSHLQTPNHGLWRSVDSPQNRADDSRPLSPSTNPASAPPGTSLTLIRRDPASGAQWNVARIEDPPVLDVSSTNSNGKPKKQAGAPLFVEITNPGYSKFLGTEPLGMPPAGNPDDGLSAAPVNHGDMPGDDGAFTKTQPVAQNHTFRRRLWMEGSQFTDSGFGHKRLGSHDSRASVESPRNSSEGWQRNGSSTDLLRPEAPAFPTREHQSYSTIQVSNRQSTFRGYVFMSPWNGRCEFITGAGGGSLKCQHLVPSLQGAPPVAMVVSELRFNLPTSSKAMTPRPEEGLKRSSFFHRPRHSRHNSAMAEARVESTEDVRKSFDRMDLSLGQEFAGGGFGGREVKLGKLIIDDEGLKMVDLLVATNIALWWRAYEKRDIRVKTDRGSSF